MNDGSTLIIPSSLTGIVSYLPVHKPTIVELSHIELNAEEPCWDPENSSCAEQEEGMVDFKGQVIINSTTATTGQVMISSMFALLQASAADVTADENFAIVLKSNVSVEELIVDASKVCPLMTNLVRSGEYHLRLLLEL